MGRLLVTSSDQVIQSGESLTDTDRDVTEDEGLRQHHVPHGIPSESSFYIVYCWLYLIFLANSEVPSTWTAIINPGLESSVLLYRISSTDVSIQPIFSKICPHRVKTAET